MVNDKHADGSSCPSLRTPFYCCHHRVHRAAPPGGDIAPYSRSTDATADEVSLLITLYIKQITLTAKALSSSLFLSLTLAVTGLPGLLSASLLRRPMSLHPSLCSYVGVWGEDSRGFHDSSTSGSKDEKRLDAHRTQTFWTLRSRYRINPIAREKSNHFCVPEAPLFSSCLLSSPGSCTDA